MNDLSGRHLMAFIKERLHEGCLLGDANLSNAFQDRLNVHVDISSMHLQYPSDGRVNT